MSSLAHTPNLLVSLDFELRWGVHDSVGSDVDAYRSNIEGVRDVVPRLLRLFEALGIRATWATVGALACENWDDYLVQAPPPPTYLDRRFDFDPRWMDRDPEGDQHFARELVEAIAATTGQEVGSHTFGHIFFREPGVMRRDVTADTAAASAVLSRCSGYAPRSLVFPRNQMHFFGALREGGINVIRDNAPGWWWGRTEAVQQSALVRGLRFASTFWPHITNPARVGEICSLPASAFLRFNLPAPMFEQSRRALVRRARDLREGETLHLWFHPHNLGDAPAEKSRRLQTLLESVQEAAPSAVWRTFGEFSN